MRIRHRVPSVFNIALVDMLCCSLGCFILWTFFLKERDKESSIAAGEKDQRIALLETRLTKLRQEEEALRKLLADTRDSETASKKQVEELLAKLATLGTEKSDLEKTLASRDKTLSELEKKRAALDGLLALRLKEIEELEKKVLALGKDRTTLEMEKTASAKRIDELKAMADDLEKRLAKAQAALDLSEKDLRALKDKSTTDDKSMARLKLDLDDLKKLYSDLVAVRALLQKQLEGKEKDLKDAMVFKDRLLAVQKQYDDLDEKYKLQILNLTNEKAKLTDDAARLRSSMEQRFAGITLSGKRVIFLVDTSGSMDLLDEDKTPAPGKWAEVRATLARVMKSLPDLEKFQLIAFAEQVRYPLGKEGEWLDYDPRTSPQQIVEALEKIKPADGTNMYKVMESAFQYRKNGLDTVYVFSDGLPNEGPGLTKAEEDRLRYASTAPKQEQRMKDAQKSNLLGLHVRKTLKENWNRSVPGSARVKINSVGFFFESPDLGAFLWSVARENDGNFVGMSRP